MESRRGAGAGVAAQEGSPMSSATAVAASALGPGTIHEPAMPQALLHEEVVVNAAAAALQVPAPEAVVTIVISQPEEEAPEPKVIAPASLAPLEGDDGSTMAAVASVKEAALATAPVTIVISQPEEAPEPKVIVPVSPAPLAGGDDSTMAAVAAVKEAALARSDSFDEQCRVCQQKSEEPLVDLGCRCRGDLSKAHRSCIDVWFRTRGSNKCEICQQVAVNIPPPETQASTSYLVWRVDSAYGRGREGRERGWFSPLWVAFAILIGGLLLDVLISVSLGVSALPVNIIIGVLIVLGLGTALRLALECCQEFGSRRSMPRLENMAPSGYHPGV